MKDGLQGLEIVDDARTGQRALRATCVFGAGEVVAVFGVASTHEAPARMTMQADEGVHIRFEPPWLALTNHACEPNAVFLVAAGEVRALKRIEAGEELTCFYPATEWEMAEPFVCVCGAAGCVGEVRGAKEMNTRALAGHVLAPHIRRRLEASGRLQSQ